MAQEITKLMMDAIMRQMVGGFEVSDGMFTQLSAPAPPSVTGLAVEVKPKIFNPAQEQAYGSSWAKRAIEPQKKIFSTLSHHNVSPQFGDPITSNEHVLGSHWLSSDLSSQKDVMLPGISDYRQYGTAANINEQAFSDHSKSSFFDTKNVGFLPAHAGSPAVSKVLAPSSHWLSSSVDSRNDINLPVFSGGLQISRTAETNEQASSSLSKSSFLSTRKVTFLPKQDGHLRSGSSTDSTMPNPNSLLKPSILESNIDSISSLLSDCRQSVRAAEVNNQDSSIRSKSSSSETIKVTFLLDQDTPCRSGSPAESKVQAPNNHLMSSPLDSRKDAPSLKLADNLMFTVAVSSKTPASSCSVSPKPEFRKETALLKHEECKLSSTPAVSKEIVLDNSSEVKGVDYRKDSPSLDYVHPLQSGSPEENKQLSSSHLESRSNRGNHSEELESYSNNKKKSGIAKIGKIEVNMQKEASLLQRTQVKGIVAPNEGIGSLSQLNNVSILPSLRSSSGRDVERSGSSSRRRSRSPRSRRLRSPHRRRSRSPRRRRSRSPRSRSPLRQTERDRIYGYTHHYRHSDQSRDGRGESTSSKGRSERGGVFSDKDGTAIDTVTSDVSQYPATVEEEERHLKVIMTETNALSKLGVHLIRWAGFHSISGNEFIKNTLPHCQLKTEACAKMMTSFKCSLKPEHRDHCLNYVRNLRHPALSPPSLDADFLNLMVEKGAVASTASFCQVINPLDNHLQTLQNNLLKCAHPMFLACNEYELNLKPGSDTRAQLFTALEKTISLCRKTLVLLGLSYSSTSAFRQEKIMEAVDLKEAAPKPSNFPNLEDSLLFGKDYMSKLRKWLNKTKHPVEVTYNLLTPEQKQQQVSQAKPRKGQGKSIVDPLAIPMIDHLLEYNVKNWNMKGNDTVKPQFWFLFDETSEEYKYYRLKMCEMQKLKRATMDAKVEANAYQRTPEDLANESVRAMILAKKIKAVKKRFRKDLPFQKKKKRIIKRTIGTQSELKAPLVQEQPTTFKESSARQEPVEAVSSGPSAIPDAPNAPQTSEVGEIANPPISNTSVASEPLINLQYPEVDVCTKETAENLARFLVEMGHKLSGFNLSILHNKPKFWFLKEKDSPAFKFYYMKFTELCHASGLSYDPHKLDRMEEVNPEESQSRISKYDHSNPAGGKISESLLTNSDCEMIVPEEPNSQATFPLVTYCSESDSSDTEDPPLRSTAKDLEPKTLLTEAEKADSLLLAKCSPTPHLNPQTTLLLHHKSANLLCHDRKPNPFVPEGQNPLAEDLICQDAVAQNWKTLCSGIQSSAGGGPVMTVIENPSGLHDQVEKGTIPIHPQLIGSEAGSWVCKEVHNLDLEEMEIGEHGAIDARSGNDGLEVAVTECRYPGKK